MKLMFILTLALSALAFAYCEIGNRQSMYWSGGHQEAIYKFGNGRSFILTCPHGYDSCPYTVRYDFWEGHFCY